jgi:uncharacterized protein YunC (DUF1805 family)
MIESSELKLRNGIVETIKINLPHAPLILIHSKQGYVMCGYLDMTIANKLGDIAAKVKGVTSIEQTLEASIVDLSDEAHNFDVQLGMSAKRFLNTIMQEAKK